MFSNLSKANFNKLKEHQSMSFYCLAISMSNNRMNVHTIENIKTESHRWCRGGVLDYVVMFTNDVVVVSKGRFYVKKGQNFEFCHPSSQRFCSNVLTNKKQKWATLFHVTLNASWDIGFWNLGNFRAFFFRNLPFWIFCI